MSDPRLRRASKAVLRSHHVSALADARCAKHAFAKHTFGLCRPLDEANLSRPQWAVAARAALVDVHRGHVEHHLSKGGETVTVGPGTVIQQTSTAECDFLGLARSLLCKVPPFNMYMYMCMQMCRHMPMYMSVYPTAGLQELKVQRLGVRVSGPLKIQSPSGGMRRKGGGAAVGTPRFRTRRGNRPREALTPLACAASRYSSTRPEKSSVMFRPGPRPGTAPLRNGFSLYLGRGLPITVEPGSALSPCAPIVPQALSPPTADFHNFKVRNVKASLGSQGRQVSTLRSAFGETFEAPVSGSPREPGQTSRELPAEFRRWGTA